MDNTVVWEAKVSRILWLSAICVLIFAVAVTDDSANQFLPQHMTYVCMYISGRLPRRFKCRKLLVEVFISLHTNGFDFSHTICARRSFDRPRWKRYCIRKLHLGLQKLTFLHVKRSYRLPMLNELLSCMLVKQQMVLSVACVLSNLSCKVKFWSSEHSDHWGSLKGSVWYIWAALRKIPAHSRFVF